MDPAIECQIATLDPSTLLHWVLLQSATLLLSLLLCRMPLKTSELQDAQLPDQLFAKGLPAPSYCAPSTSYCAQLLPATTVLLCSSYILLRSAATSYCAPPTYLLLCSAATVLLPFLHCCYCPSVLLLHPTVLSCYLLLCSSYVPPTVLN